MPIIKSAIKKMRQDKARTKVNQLKRAQLKKVLKTTSSKLTKESLGQAFSALDKATKTGLIHKNKAARQKATLAKKLATSAAKSPKPKAKISRSKKAK
jgi:small subunit ribosomal protein S20